MEHLMDNIVGMNLYRAYAAFALVGAAIGLYTPV